jgi:hypothetical protein
MLLLAARCADILDVEIAGARVSAARAALQPYRWWQLTPEMLVRRILVAVDTVGPARPGHADYDPRRETLVAALGAVSWRRLTLTALCDRLLTALDEWQTADAWFHLELTWLLEEGA